MQAFCCAMVVLSNANYPTNLKQHFIFYWAKIIRSFKNPKSVFFSSKLIENIYTADLYFLSKRCTQTTWREPLITCAMMLLFSAFFTLSISVKLKYDWWMTLFDHVFISFRSNLNIAQQALKIYKLVNALISFNRDYHINSPQKMLIFCYDDKRFLIPPSFRQEK